VPVEAADEALEEAPEAPVEAPEAPEDAPEAAFLIRLAKVLPEYNRQWITYRGCSSTG
jgi:hypothetical protein